MTSVDFSENFFIFFYYKMEAENKIESENCLVSSVDLYKELRKFCY